MSEESTSIRMVEKQLDDLCCSTPKSADLRTRTKEFALRMIRLRSGNSVGAQYREATGARSRAEFISQVQSAFQEHEETQHWLELIVESEPVRPTRLAPLRNEAEESLSMLAASVKTARNRQR